MGFVKQVGNEIARGTPGSEVGLCDRHTALERQKPGEQQVCSAWVLVQEGKCRVE